MSKNDILHEVGILIFGFAAIHLTLAAPLDARIKNAIACGIAFVTGLAMANVAGVV